MSKKRQTIDEKMKYNKLTAGEIHALLALQSYTIDNIIDRDTQKKIDSWMVTSFTIPKYFPRELGIKLYNENLQNLISEGEKAILWENKEERKRVMCELKNFIQTFRTMTDRAINKEKPTQEDYKILEKSVLKGEILRVKKDEKTGHFSPAIYVILHPPNDYFWIWVYGVWRGEIKVKRCKAEDCNKIFIPKRSDQEYCSKRCAKRAWAQRNISLER